MIGYSAPTLFINEFMPSNVSTLMDENGEYDDWVELYNPNEFEVDLAGYYLTDDHYPDIAHLCQIPWTATTVVIPAHGFKLLWFDEQPAQGPLHINAKLGTTTDAIHLIAPDMLHSLDAVSWNADTGLAADLSFGRMPDGNSYWTLFGGVNPNPVTPGTNNTSVANEDEQNTPVAISLNVYPNPARNVIYLELKGAKQAVKVKIYNLKGQLVKEISANPESKSTWNILDKNNQRVGSGIYFLRTEIGGKELVKKICLIP